MSLIRQSIYVPPHRRWQIVWGASSLLLMPLTSEASGFIDFEGTLLEGTCDISAPPMVNLGNLDVTRILANPNSWATVGNGLIQVKISGCQGSGGTKTAGIAITGQLSTDPGVSANTSLFKTGGESKGFGVVVSYGNTRLSQGSMLYITVPGADDIVVRNLTAAVSGGEKYWAGAQNQNMKSGTLTASVTLTFGYR